MEHPVCHQYTNIHVLAPAVIVIHPNSAMPSVCMYLCKDTLDCAGNSEQPAAAMPFDLPWTYMDMEAEPQMPSADKFDYQDLTFSEAFEGYNADLPADDQETSPKFKTKVSMGNDMLPALARLHSV